MSTSKAKVSKKFKITFGASAILFGGALGLLVTPDTKQDIASKHNFREKLEAIKLAVERGEIIPFQHNGVEWVAESQRNVDVADWQQTWEKQNWDKKV